MQGFPILEVIELTLVPAQNGGRDDDWSVDTSEAAMKARMEDLSDQASSLALSSELELATKKRVDLFYKFVEVRTSIHPS